MACWASAVAIARDLAGIRDPEVAVAKAKQPPERGGCFVFAAVRQRRSDYCLAGISALAGAAFISAGLTSAGFASAGLALAASSLALASARLALAASCLALRASSFCLRTSSRFCFATSAGFAASAGLAAVAATAGVAGVAGVAGAWAKAPKVEITRAVAISDFLSISVFQVMAMLPCTYNSR